MSENQSKRPLGKALAAVLVAGGGWAFARHYEIEGLDRIEVRPRTVVAAPGGDDLDTFISSSASWDAGANAGGGWIDEAVGTLSKPVSTRIRRSDDSPHVGGDGTVPRPGEFELPHRAVTARPIRVGSWALAGFGRDKLAKPQVMDLFSRLVRQFDVIAVQQITSPERDLLPRMVEHINRTGRRYDFLLGPIVGPDGSGPQPLGEQYAFFFDTERVETDRGQLYTVSDPENHVTYDPLVAWFRVRGVPADEAWTFSLANFRVDTSRSAQEVPLLGQLMAAVAADGRGEDDLLLGGLLQADDRQIAAQLGREQSEAVVQATPTDIFARYQLSNLILPKRTTTEYMRRGGVIDFLRLYNLSSAEAEELSPHLPIYGEFTVTEGI